jgi:hypothetical protein
MHLDVLYSEGYEALGGGTRLIRAWGSVESRSALEQNASWVIVGYPLGVS